MVSLKSRSRSQNCSESSGYSVILEHFAFVFPSSLRLSTKRTDFVAFLIGRAMVDFDDLIDTLLSEAE